MALLETVRSLPFASQSKRGGAPKRTHEQNIKNVTQNAAATGELCTSAPHAYIQWTKHIDCVTSRIRKQTKLC